MSDITAELVTLPDLDTPIAALPLTHGRQWQDILNDVGAAELTFQNDDPALELVESPNTLVNFYLRDTIAFTMICETFESVEVGDEQRGEADERTVWRGRGHLALLDRAATYPLFGIDSDPVTDDRRLDYTYPAYDDSSWDPANGITDIGTAKTGWAVAWDENYPDDTAEVLGPSDSTLLDVDDGNAENQNHYFRQPIFVEIGGPHILFFSTDNIGELYIDGRHILSSQTYTRTVDDVVDITAGVHIVSWVVSNYPQADANPCGAAWSLYRPGYPPPLVAHSDSTFATMLEYQEQVPGMTPGEAIRILLEEAQVRGTIPYVDWDFTDTDDSADLPWGTVSDIATKVGTSLLTFLRELSATYIDFAFDAGGLTLHAWNKGGRGGTPGVAFNQPTDPQDPSTGNLTFLSRRGET